MVKAEIKKLESIVRLLYFEMGTMRNVAEFYDISVPDTIYLLFATEDSQLEYFKDKTFDHLPIFNIS